MSISVKKGKEDVMTEEGDDEFFFANELSYRRSSIQHTKLSETENESNINAIRTKVDARGRYVMHYQDVYKNNPPT